MKREIHPGAAFAHPLFAVALVVLVLNDHALKGAGILPPLVTGKLSDVAGLLVAPAVLAWIGRARTWRGWVAAHLAVGAGFTALELAPALVAKVESASAWIGLPMRMWPDPTDLLALPALAVSLVVLPSERRPAPALIGVFALVACTATSHSSPPPRYPFRPRGVVEADLMLRHTGSEDLSVSVRRLRDGLEVDCDGLLEAPQELLDAGDFTEPRSWTLARGDGIPLWDRVEGAPTRECYAVRLTARGHEWLLTWRHGTPPLGERELRLEPDVPAEPTAVVLNEGDAPPRVPPGVRVRRP